MGVRGAAWATAFSQILGAAALLATLQLVSKVTDHTERWTCSLELCTHAADPSGVLKHLSVAVQVKPIPSIPSRHDLADLSSTLGPMSVIYLFKNFTYIYIQVHLNLLYRMCAIQDHRLLYPHVH